jgi:coniferyl-aldehyde dehydrogenase
MNAPMNELLARQKTAQRQQGIPMLEQRLDRIQRAISLLQKYKQNIIDAVNTDFGGRSATQSLMTEVLSSYAALTHARDHLA